MGGMVAVQVNIPQKAITARRVVTQLLHSCRRLGDVLVGVLPPRGARAAGGRAAAEPRRDRHQCVASAVG